jgi:hypothetical protein
MALRIAVLGAGLQGACVALEFAEAGARVDVYEKERHLVSRASANNNGKIHLGYVWANDRSLRTASLMVRGALTFFPYLRRFLGPKLAALPVSAPFSYLVHRNSLKTAEEVEAHLNAVNRLSLERVSENGLNYLQADHTIAPRRVPLDVGPFESRSVVAAFSTPELAIDPEFLADLTRETLISHPDIRCITGARVQSARPFSNSVVVRFLQSGAPSEKAYDHVINTLWDGRLAVDNSFGIKPKRPWLHRVKYFAAGKAPGATLPCCTVLLGPFGDIVTYTGRVYLSWYPAGMLAKSTELHPPDWPTVLTGTTADEIRRHIINGLSDIVPGVAGISEADASQLNIKGATIFAWGDSDIDDPRSSLHERFDVGPKSFGRYHSIDTGKLTTAPLFARELATAVLRGRT